MRFSARTAGSLVVLVLALGACRQGAATGPGGASDAAAASTTPSVPASAASTSASASPPPASASAKPSECAPYADATGSRKLKYARVGNPAAHPGCTLVEAGDLQCAEDFADWTPKSKVRVPTADARAVLDEIERVSLAGGCECPTPAGRADNYPPLLCKGTACVFACGDARARLDALRARFASTKTATTVNLDH